MLDTAFIVGIDHHLSGVDERAVLASLNVEDLKDKLSLKELYILETCNRFEIYGVASCMHSVSDAKTVLEDILKEKTNNVVKGHVYQKTGLEMLKHGFKVASSLESMVVGEPQILGQMKQAFKKARKNGHIGASLDKFLTTAFHVGKRVRHETSLSKEPVSVASAAMHALKGYIKPEDEKNILVIGAGEMCTAAAKHLYAMGYEQVIVLNRTFSKSYALAEELGFMSAPLSQLENWIPKVDAIVSCVNVEEPFLDQESLRDIKKPMIFVDMAVPRNIHENVKNIEGVTLIDMDRLSESIEISKEKRASHVLDATRIIDEEIEAFTKWSNERQNAHMVKHLRESFEKIRTEVLGDNPSKEAQEATKKLLGKILHHPTMMIKSGYVPTKGVEMAVDLIFGLRCPRVQFLQISNETESHAGCPFVDVMRKEGLMLDRHH